MEKKKNYKRLVAYTIGVITLGAICYYKRDTLKCAAQTLTKALKGGGNALKLNVVLSEEIPVIQEIVDNLTDSAKLIAEAVKSATGETIGTANIFSNMAGHPKSGILEIPLDGLTEKGIEAVKHYSTKIMGQAGVVINNVLYFD